MALSSYVIIVFFLCVSYIGCDDSETPKLTDFGEKVKKNISENTLKKIYATNFENDEQLKNATEKGSKTFYEILGLKFNEHREEKEESEAENVGLEHLDTEKLFDGQTYAISKVLRSLGKLTDENVDDLAQKYADELTKYAKPLKKDDDFYTTFVALSTAGAKFFKSLDVKSEKSVHEFEKYFIAELKKDKKHEKESS